MIPVIDVQSLTRSYGNRRGIRDINLAIPPGSLYGFLGPNGAGKTTTIRVLLGFLRPTSGAARIFGQDCWTNSAAIKADIGTIPGDLRLWPWLTGHAALALFGRIRQRDLRAHGLRLAEELELDLSVRVRAMSRGMRQKLGLILALAHQPKLLILDEPTTALDPLMQDRLRSILLRMANAGHTVFFSSHTLSEVETLCQRVAIVRAGRIVADSTLTQLQHNAGHDVDIHWHPQATPPSEIPPGLTLTHRTDHQWTGSLQGPVQPLLALLARHHVDDLKIARPDLDTLFRRYYEREENAS